MRRVILESPYAGHAQRNEAYARAALRDSLMRGEAPLASHLLYTQVLEDRDFYQRKMGIEAGLAWTPLAELVAVYQDFGISEGMAKGILRAAQAGIPIEYRNIGVDLCL